MEKRREHHGKGIGGLDRHAWVTLAEERVFELIDQRLAVPHLEIEARLFELGWVSPTGTIRFFPHILSEAINNLVSGGNIQLVSHVTKGSQPVDLYVPGNARLRATAIEKATRRKAMLYARYLRCSATFGQAGESVVRDSIADAAPYGYLPITQAPQFGEVRRIGETALPGALDSGAWVVVKQAGLPLPVHSLLVEVKNRRLTLYPRHDEVHQLLAKAALVQQQNPGLPVVPLLICRRAHDRLFWMAKDLGFLAHAARAQYLTMPRTITEQHVEQLRTELALHDLRVVSPATTPRISQLFTNTIPKEAAATAHRWATVGSLLLHHYEVLRRDETRLSHHGRSEALAALRTEAEKVLTDAGVTNPILAWALEEESP